jgi:predicted transcriptional regulator
MADIDPKMRRWRWLVWSEVGPPGPAKRAILQVLLDFLATSPEGRVFPSVETLAVKTDLTEKSVGRHIAELEAAGWLARYQHGTSGQGWRRYGYRLTFPKHIDPSADPWLKEAAQQTEKAAAEARPKLKAVPAPEIKIPYGVDPQAWREWHAYYTTRVHGGMSEAAAKNSGGRLYGFSVEVQRACVKASIEGGYMQPMNKRWQTERNYQRGVVG